MNFSVTRGIFPIEISIYSNRLSIQIYGQKTDLKVLNIFSIKTYQIFPAGETFHGTLWLKKSFANADSGQIWLLIMSCFLQSGVILNIFFTLRRFASSAIGHEDSSYYIHFVSTYTSAPPRAITFHNVSKVVHFCLSVLLGNFTTAK